MKCAVQLVDESGEVIRDASLADPYAQRTHAPTERIIRRKESQEAEQETDGVIPSVMELPALSISLPPLVT